MTEGNFTLPRGINIKALSNAVDELLVVGVGGELTPSGVKVDDINSKNLFTAQVLDESRIVGISDIRIGSSDSNLIAIDVDELLFPSYDIMIENQWLSTDVGTFRLDITVNAAQTISLVSGGSYMTIDNLADINLPASGIASILFDKPYGTTTWYVRQSI